MDMMQMEEKAMKCVICHGEDIKIMFSRKGAKTQRKDGQYNRDKNQIKDGIERVVSGLQAFVNAGRMLFFAPFAALRETDVEPGRLG